MRVSRETAYPLDHSGGGNGAGMRTHPVLLFGGIIELQQTTVAIGQLRRSSGAQSGHAIGPDLKLAQLLREAEVWCEHASSPFSVGGWGTLRGGFHGKPR